MRTFKGGCQCGRVRFRLTADLAHVAECNCSICTKKGFLHLIGPRNLSRQGRPHHYEFNTLTAKYMFCRHCGIHDFYVPRSDPDKFSVNVRCLDDVDLDKIRLEAFDGKHWKGRSGTTCGKVLYVRLR